MRFPAKKIIQKFREKFFSIEVDEVDVVFDSSLPFFKFEKPLINSRVILDVSGVEVNLGVDVEDKQLVRDTSSGIIYQLLESATSSQTLNNISKKIVANDKSDITREPTGFTEPENVDVSYNGTTRTITLTGSVAAYKNGVQVAELTDGYVSPPHDEGDGAFFLYHNGTDAVWADSFDFKQILIALVYRDTANFCIRECHGLMQWQSHFADHFTIGTWLKSGGDLDDFVLNSTTAADRRPSVAASLIYDEDLPTNLLGITDNYTRLQLVDGGNTTFVQEQTDIINLDGNRPYYNEFDGTNWVQTLFPVNAYGKIFLMAIPVTSDAECQKNRYVFIQPQTVSTSIEEIRAIQPSSINIGHISSALSEFVFIGEIIVRWTSNNWRFIETNKLTGTRANQISSPSGNFLTVVNTDATLEGLGTTSEPLSWTGAGAGDDNELIKVAADGKTASRSGVFANDGNIDISTGKNYKINGAQITSSNLADGVDLVKGSASALENTIPRFDGITGKLIKAGGSITNLDNGNVGIATNNPTERLHVIGNILSSGEVHAGTKIIIENKVEQVYDSVNESLKFNFL